jgi:hypothetical protein
MSRMWKGTVGSRKNTEKKTVKLKPHMRKKDGVKSGSRRSGMNGRV